MKLAPFWMSKWLVEARWKLWRPPEARICLLSVEPARLLIEVFEDMIAGEGFARICDFLGIARVEASPVRVHQGTPVPMSAAQRHEALAGC